MESSLKIGREISAASNMGYPMSSGARRRISVSAVVLAIGLGSASPAPAADTARGEQLARQWCATCHVLPGNPDQAALQGPPSFRDLARGAKSPEQIRIFLMRPHGAMPPLTLSRAEIDDLVGYIETLR